jgi:short-subunit dehydrogenase
MRGKMDKLAGLVVVTGSSSGIGLELAKRAAKDGVDLVLAADTPFDNALPQIRAAGSDKIETLECDLATDEGIDALLDLIGDRPVAALMANAGQGGGAIQFLDQEWYEALQTINTNITGTIRLIQQVGQRMRARDDGRILVTGSIAGHLPGSYQLVYNSTKSFIDYFCAGLRNELKDTGVAVTCLLPGATDTAFFERAHMENTRVGEAQKANPAKVAEDGYAAMLADEDQTVSGFMNKIQVLFGDILPDAFVAQLHRKQAEPLDKQEDESVQSTSDAVGKFAARPD